jgi:GGDEF domain-containing protein
VINTSARAAWPATEALRVMLHEVRTPLSSIQGYASVLLTGELGDLTPRQRDVLERLHGLAHHLTSLTSNLNQLVRLTDEPSAMAWEPVDVAQLVRSVSQDLAGEAHRKGVRLTARAAPSLPVLWAERAGLTQVLINLVVNAIKFTPAGGTVTVSAALANGAVRLDVRDTGVGIDRQALPKLFKAFYHADRPEAGAMGGTGLGLAIVKQAVERHHGSVKAVSRPGRGSLFRVVLPQRSAQEVVRETVQRLIQWARRRRRPFAVLHLEARGADEHARAGAEVSTRLERLAQEAIEAEDRWYPVRRGELVVLLTRARAARARQVVTRLTERLQQDPVLRKARRIRITVGMAAYPTHGRAARRLLHAARERTHVI